MATVLVVDDEFGIADLIQDILVDEGHHVLSASNGRQGLEAMAAARPDLVFLDYMMPRLDGAGVLRAMAQDPSLQGVPVVVMSSMPEATIAERCTGYTAFMRKPFRVAELMRLAGELTPRDTPKDTPSA